MTIGQTHVRYVVGVCPACSENIDVIADVEVVPTMATSTNPEQPMIFEGKVTGGVVQKHDCRPKVTR